MTDSIDRRTFVIGAGGVTTAAFLAGCLGNGDDGDDGDDDDGVDGFEISPGTIVFDGYQSHWEGVEPADIEGEQNPTLILEAGGEYEMEWVNADGMLHDLQIWDDDGNLVDGLQTDELDGEGESDSITFTASEEMTTYVCTFHQTTQIGDLVVE